jgi:murein DD-endopeptidase MepM/ murein hydrolase activator NlpD
MKKLALLGALLVGMTGSAWFIYTNLSRPEEIAADLVAEAQPQPERPTFKTVRYGIDLQEMYLCTEQIQPQENLGTILSRNGVALEVINEAVEKSQNVLDHRKISAGKSYSLLRNANTDALEYFVYEQDPVHFVVFDFKGPVEVRSGKNPLEIVTRGASGSIQSSLWNTFEENNLPQDLALEMAEVYAWTIDFFRLQKGDHFKVLFEEHYVDGRSVGIGAIKGAVFNHGGEDFHAIQYEQDDQNAYYDINAKSLRRAFLKAPLEFRRISSHFNKKRFHPILKRSRPHLGTDYAAATGTPIWTVGDGTVVRAEFNRGSGNFVEIQHNNTYTTKYLHMSKFGAGIKKGVRVKQGQVIGYVGSTGLSTGPHLHYELIKNGKHVDALTETIPSGDPIDPACMESFAIYRDQIIQQLDRIPAPAQRFAELPKANGKN